jgi:hypothetical protein
MRVLHAMLPSLLCLGACQDTVAPRPEVRPSASVVSGDSVRLTYICGNTFRIRNANDAFVEVKWDIYNTPDSGRLVLPKRPAGTAFSQVFVTAARRGTMRVFVNGRLEETKANGNRPACSTEGQETPWPAEESPDVTWDESRTIFLGGTVRARRDFLLEFNSDAAVSIRLAALNAVGATPTSRTGPSNFVIRTPDPGTDSTSYSSLLSRLRALPGVRRVAPVYLTGGIPLTSSRYPSDSASSFGRGLWGQGNDAVHHLLLSWVPQAWGCQPNDRPVVASSVGVFEWEHSQFLADVAADFASPTLSSPDTEPVATENLRSGWREHAAHTTGLVAAIGDNNIGTAGGMWNTRIRAMELNTSSHRRVPLAQVPSVLASFIESVSVLSLSIDLSLDKIIDTSDRAYYVDDLARSLGRALRRSPSSQVVVSAGNTPWDGTVAGFRQATSDSQWFLLALLQVRQDSAAPAVRDQVVVATGARADGSWASRYRLNSSQGAPHFWNATDIAAQAEDVTVLSGGSPGSAAAGALRDGVFGTSLAAPQVAAALGSMLKSQPGLTPSERKELLLSGAATMRADVATGIPKVPTPVIPAANQRAAVPLLNSYNALVALSQSSANMPICGSRITFDAVGESVVPRISGDSASGGRALPLPSGYTIRPRGDLDMGRYADWGSVAQGGRRITVNAVSAEGQPSLVEFNLGSAGWIASAPQPSAYRRVYLERDTAYWRFYVPTEFDVLPLGYIKRATGDSVAFDGATFRQNLPRTGAIGAFIGSLAFSPDGALVSAAYALGPGGCDPTAGTLVTTGVAVLNLRTNVVRDLHREPGANCASGGPVPWITNVAWHPSSRSLVRWTSFSAFDQPTSSQYVMQRLSRSPSNTFSTQGSTVTSESPIISEHMIFRGDGTAVIVDEWKLDDFQSPTPCVERAYPALDVTVTNRTNCKARSEMPMLRSAPVLARAATPPALPRPLWQPPTPPAAPNHRRARPAQ